MNDMVSLHDNDIHFNLVISEDSDLAKYGSLSHRFNICPLGQESDSSEVFCNKVDINEEEEESEVNEVKDSQIANLKKELRKCKQAKDDIQKEYFKCEKELRIKTEEVEKMKIEIKDLRKIVKLRNEMKDKNVEFSSMEVDEDDSVNEAKRLYQMKTGGSARNGPQVESAPKKNLANKKSNDKEFKCKNVKVLQPTKLANV